MALLVFQEFSLQVWSEYIRSNLKQKASAQLTQKNNFSRKTVKLTL